MRDQAGQISGVFCEGFDVTEQVDAETALRDADRRKDEFLATLAHELRNPLAPISNAAALLQHPAIRPAAVLQYAEMIQRQTKTMAVLLDDLLEVSRISTGKLKLHRQSVPLRYLVEVRLEPVRPAIAAKMHQISVDVDDVGDALVEVISASSEGLGRGSRFDVVLPIGDVTVKREAEPVRQSEAPTGRPRVLVADDNVDAADSLAAILSMRGYDVDVAYDGEEAARLAASAEPAACFLDIGMPGLNGCELATLLRQQGSRSVLVAITDWGTLDDRRMTHEAGFDLHLTKPVDPAMAVNELAVRLQARMEQG